MRIGNTWRIEYYSDKTAEEILKFPPEILAKYFRLLDRIKHYGPNLGMPYTRSLGDGLFELRIKAMEGIARVIFINTAGKMIVVLSSFIKKTDKTPLNELQTAIRRKDIFIKYGRQ